MAKPVWAATANGSWATAGNWSTGSAPVNGDEVLFRSNTFSVNDGLDQSGVTLNELEFTNSFTGDIGTAAAELQISSTLLYIGRSSGQGTGAGSARMKINFGTIQFAGHIYASQSTALDANLEPIRIRGTHAANALHVYGGIVGVGTNNPADVATVATVNQYGGTLNLGLGCTLTTINVQGTAPILTVRSAYTTLTQDGGSVTVYGTGAATTARVQAGTLTNYSTGTITTAHVQEGATMNQWSGAATITTLNWAGTFDASRALGTITVTNCNRLSDDAVLNDPLGRVVFTNPILNAQHVRSANNIYRRGGGTIQVA